MNETAPTYQSWSSCESCGYQGLAAFRCRHDENYGDADALGVMMDTTCPACGEDEAVLVVMEEYREMVLIAEQRRR